MFFFVRIRLVRAYKVMKVALVASGMKLVASSFSFAALFTSLGFSIPFFYPATIHFL